MTVVVAPDFVVALARKADPRHKDAVELLELLDEELVTSPLALADIDRLVTEQVGAEAARRVRRDFSRGAYNVRWWADALTETLALSAEYPDIDLTTASLVALARRMNTRRIAGFNPTLTGLAIPGGETVLALPSAR